MRLGKKELAYDDAEICRQVKYLSSRVSLDYAHLEREVEGDRDIDECAYLLERIACTKKHIALLMKVLDTKYPAI
jgi:hypothetical protein